MFKFTQTSCAAILLTTIAWADLARSENTNAITAPVGSYRGGGYQAISDGRSGDYTGFDRQGHKLVIHRPTYPADRTVEWKNKGYTYRLTGIGKSQDDSPDLYGKVMLTISNPQGRVILNQMMNRIN
jgi:hypothetical protein